MAGKSGPSFDGLPSYSESISTTSNSTPALPNDIARARSALVSTLVTTHIIPHLHTNSLSGLSNTTLLIVPASVFQLQQRQPSNENPKGSWTPSATFPQETVVGFPSAENLTVVRLRGQENSLGFWSQPVVLSELEQQLRSQLQMDGHELVGSNPSQRTASSAEWRTVTKKPLQAGEASVEVGMKEIGLRFENAMGLYETRTGKAVVVKVEMGG